MITSDKKTVFVGLSGGVDSAVSALRLQKRGYNVVGVFIKVWQPDFINCNWQEERLDAMRVAAKLNIPFLTCDAEEAYKKDVADYFISEYKNGRTPNPDVMCNQYVKFGAFLKFAKEHQADYIATGHYAQNQIIDGKNTLWRGLDKTKDQSYFLWTLTREQLAYSLFPVGDTPKATIRKEAESAGLLVAQKNDSQGICFLGQVDIPDFLSHYIKLKAGSVINETGDIIGTHQGALVYTIGQRHGFSITTSVENTEPHYVVSRDLETNTITVSPNRPKTTPQTSKLHLTDVNWLGSEDKPEEGILIQIRYRQEPVKATMGSFTLDQKTAVINLVSCTDLPARGQSCVFYTELGQCLGGGIIAEIS